MDSIEELSPVDISSFEDDGSAEKSESLEEFEEKASVSSDDEETQPELEEVESDEDDDSIVVGEEGDIVSVEEAPIPENIGISLQSVIQSDDEESDDDSSDSEDEYKKFDEDIKTNLIEEYHKELKHINYDEITALTKVVRNENGNVIDPIHKTVPFLTKFERARILGVRAKQINNGADSFIDIPEDIIDGHIIAEMELERKAIPFIIARPLPNGKKEYWKVSDLELIDY